MSKQFSQTRYVSSNVAHLPILEAVSRGGSGTGFTILMEYPGKHSNATYKDFGIFPRFGQPCQGGDMRRYDKTHPGKATQPHNARPGDLSQPFPEGIPSAIAFHNLKPYASKRLNAFLEDLFADDSPWRAGFGSRSNVLFYEDDEENYIGWILKDLQIDPTVLVNLLGFMNSFMAHSKKPYLDLIAEGLTKQEALAVLMLNGGQSHYIAHTDSYRFPPVFSARRFFEGRPNDLSGGTYRDGADYNRTYVQDVFLGDKAKGGIVWNSAATKIGSDLGIQTTGGMTVKQVAQIAKEVFAKGLAEEPELTEDDVKYVYRDAMGTVLPYPEAALKANPALKNETKVEKAKKAAKTLLKAA